MRKGIAKIERKIYWQIRKFWKWHYTELLWNFVLLLSLQWNNHGWQQESV